MTKTKRRGSVVQRRLIPTYIFLTICSFISVFPLYWMMSAATNKSIDVAIGRIVPGTYLVENFKRLIELTTKVEDTRVNVWTSMGYSFIFAAAQTVATLFVCSLAGYGFELYHDKAKDKVFGVLLLAMMIPQVATMIPLYKLISSMKLTSTVLGFILPAVSTPFMIMMFRQNSRNFPPDIMEAARIDGLSEWRIFFRMYMPVQKSTYAAAAVITFMNAWNAYLWPRVILTDDKVRTMPMVIANLSSGYTIDYGVLMLGVLFCSFPTIIIFFILQKQFAEGITGAVK